MLPACHTSVLPLRQASPKEGSLSIHSWATLLKMLWQKDFLTETEGLSNLVVNITSFCNKAASDQGAESRSISILPSPLSREQFFYSECSTHRTWGSHQDLHPPYHWLLWTLHWRLKALPSALTVSKVCETPVWFLSCMPVERKMERNKQKVTKCSLIWTILTF